MDKGYITCKRAVELADDKRWDWYGLSVAFAGVAWLDATCLMAGKLDYHTVCEIGFFAIVGGLASTLRGDAELKELAKSPEDYVERNFGKKLVGDTSNLKSLVDKLDIPALPHK